MMAAPRLVAGRQVLVAMVVGMGLVAMLAVRPAVADVMAIKGSATGFVSFVGLSGGAPTTRGPAPTVRLPATGSAAPLNAAADSGTVQYGPAVLFQSGALRVSTQATSDGNGSVSSAATVAAIGSGPVRAGAASSSCTASRSGSRGSGAVDDATVVTQTNPATGAPAGTVAVPRNPAANYSVEGALHTGDRFRAVFNEQVAHPDGSITVNAVHVQLLGPTAVGDLFIGQVICGMRSTTSATTAPPGVLPPAARAAPPPGASGPAVEAQTAAQAAPVPESTTTTTAAARPRARSSTVPGDAVLVAGAQTAGVTGGAFGYYTSVSLFGGPAQARGPAPNVDLPAGGSASPVTGSDGSALAQFGPATIFSSDRLEVSTEGTAAGGSVTSSATVSNVNKSGQEVFTAATLKSTCTASGSGATGSTTLSGAKVIVSEGPNLDIDTDDVVVPIPDNPAPNTSYEGKIEAVGDSFRLVVNEQTSGDGAMTVNAAHMYLLGPIAVGELTVGQSRCSLTGASAGTTGDGGSSRGGTSGGGGVASTGANTVRMVALALDFVVLGCIATRWAGRRRGARPEPISQSIP